MVACAEGFIKQETSEQRAIWGKRAKKRLWAAIKRYRERKNGHELDSMSPFISRKPPPENIGDDKSQERIVQ
jgi:hypothetical protein